MYSLQGPRAILSRDGLDSGVASLRDILSGPFTLVHTGLFHMPHSLKIVQDFLGERQRHLKLDMQIERQILERKVYMALSGGLTHFESHMAFDVCLLWVMCPCAACASGSRERQFAGWSCSCWCHLVESWVSGQWYGWPLGAKFPPSLPVTTQAWPLTDGNSLECKHC